MSGESIVLKTEEPIEELTRQIVDIPSPSGKEAGLADALEAALVAAPHLETMRLGNTVAARTSLGRKHRVVWAGHIDTVPVNHNLPSTVKEGFLHGRGTVDMKGGLAIGLKLALELVSPL
ncbi:MAG: succinyl-diaminopimelate desuccinylase, partial [Pontimonas sp.]